MCKFSVVFLPCNLVDFGKCIEVSGEDEKVVAEAVDVFEKKGIDVCVACKVEYSSFGSAADGSGDVSFCGEHGSSGEDECFDFRGLLVKVVYPVFECCDVVLCKAPCRWGFVLFDFGGEVSSEVEEHILDLE